MARIAAKVGYGVTTEVETSPGIWESVITERTLYGDLNKNFRKLENSNNGANSNITIANEVSLVADAYALNNYMYIKYVEFNGIKWEPSGVLVDHPRLIITLGGVYNG